jgi:PLP dependent protein
MALHLKPLEPHPRAGTLTVMEPRAERILSNLRELKDRIAAAAARSGRAAGTVRLVAVTKTVGPEAIRVLLGAGQREIGEGRPQQLRDRAAALAGMPVVWHFIGPLQRNKVKYVVPTAAMIHSLDSLALAEEIGRRAVMFTEPDAEASGDIQERKEHNKVNGVIPPHPGPSPAAGGGNIFEPAAGAAGDLRRREAYGARCLLEINSGEQQKGGVAPAEAVAMAASVAAVPGVNLVGLMTMAPLADDPESSRPVFAALRELRNRINRTAALPHPLTELSMGMTQDYEVAIEEGATIVRVGTALFTA